MKKIKSNADRTEHHYECTSGCKYKVHVAGRKEKSGHMKGDFLHVKICSTHVDDDDNPLMIEKQSNLIHGKVISIPKGQIEDGRINLEEHIEAEMDKLASEVADKNTIADAMGFFNNLGV